MNSELHSVKRIPLSGGFEMDFLTGWSKVLGHDAGTRKAAKRKYQRRMRRVVRASLDREHHKQRCSKRECWFCMVDYCDRREEDDEYQEYDYGIEDWEEYLNNKDNC